MRETRITPAIRIGSPLLTFKMNEKTWGINVIADASYFAPNRQIRPGAAGIWDTEDVGTGVKGFAAYLVPTLNYFGGQNLRGRNWSWRVGGGLGVGYLRATGDVLLDNPPEGATEPVASPERYRVDMNQLAIAASGFWELRMGRYTFSMLGAGPIAGEDYKINYIDISLTASYSWYRAKRGP